MTYAVVGSGKVATEIAVRFARSGIPLRLVPANDLVSTAACAGAPSAPVRFTSFEEAADADVVIFAIPFWSHRTLARRRLTWHGQIVVDAMHGALTLGARKSIDVVSHGFPGARIVKVSARRCAVPRVLNPGTPGCGTIAYLAGDDVRATKAISVLAESLGYVPVTLNRLALANCPASGERGQSTQSASEPFACAAIPGAAGRASREHAAATASAFAGLRARC